MVGGFQGVDRVVAKEFRVVVSVLLDHSMWVECSIWSETMICWFPDITLRCIPPSSKCMGFLKMF